MFCLLMVDEYFEVVEIPLAIIAPGPCEGLFDIRVLALCFTHDKPMNWASSMRLYVIESVGTS